MKLGAAPFLFVLGWKEHGRVEPVDECRSMFGECLSEIGSDWCPKEPAVRGRQRTLRPGPWLRGIWQWGHRSESWGGVFHGYLARRAPTGPDIRPSKNPPPVWRCTAEETPLVTASPSSNMAGPSPGPYPLLTIPVLPSLSVLVGWCRLAGLIHTVPLSLADAAGTRHAAPCAGGQAILERKRGSQEMAFVGILAPSTSAELPPLHPGKGVSRLAFPCPVADRAR